MPDLIVGQNSYLTLAEADTYLAGSLRAATLWAAVSDANKVLALISAQRALELESWEGSRTGVSQIGSLAVTVAGTGYVINDVVTLVGGAGTVAQAKVLTVGGSGEVLTLVLVHTGFYTTQPTAPVVVTGGTGTGLTLTPTYASAQVMDWPRTITGVTPTPVSDDVPTDLKTGQAELAFDLSQDPSLEVGAGTAGTGSNTKSVKAGSAEVEFFRHTDGVPYPSAVWQRISPYRDGAVSSTATGSVATGTDGTSIYEDRDEYDLNRGYS